MEKNNMPNIKSAKTRMKTSEKSRVRNKAVKALLSSSRRALYEAIESGTTDTAELYKGYCSIIDKAVKKNVLTRNAGSRRKSRATARITKAAA